MVSPDVVDIGSEYSVVYLSCVYTPSIYVPLILPSYLFFASTSILGISHAVENEKKFWKFI